MPATRLYACPLPAVLGALTGMMLAGCAGDPAGESEGDERGEAPVASAPDCPAVFADELLADYHVTIAADEWAALWKEFIDVAARDAAGLELKPYHPIRFRWQDSTEVAAMIRLKGQWSWRDSVMTDDPPKMQFVISFNEGGTGGRFMGLRKIELDMPRDDRSFLRQRLALAALHDLNLPAQCSASARLFINGAYYGLYLAIERMDKEFLERVFPGADQGDLWDGGAQPKTNQDSFDRERIEAYWAAQSAADLAALGHLQYSVREWAAEAVINNGDGSYGGNHNYFLYDHPTRGFLWLPHDVDASWNLRPATTSPIFPLRDEQPHDYYLLVMDDALWHAHYLKGLEDGLRRLDVAALESRVDRWADQIRSAAETDPNRPFTFEQHLTAIDRLRAAIGDRAGYLAGWLDCLDRGGTDADGDGYNHCDDCDDADGVARPGAAEQCNHLDDDCDGRIDEDVLVINGEVCP